MKKRINTVSASDRALLANIKQFGLGSWLGENAGTIGAIAGAGIGTLIAPGMGTSLGASIGGQLGGMAQKEYMSNNQPQQQISPEQLAASQENNRVYKCGGKVKKHANGGYSYNAGGDVDNTVTPFQGGGTHEQNPYGGIPIGNGNSVEAGEVKAKFKEGDYIYSNRLLTGDKKKETYADVAKRLKSKFKNADNDPVVKNDLMEELAKVRDNQEELRNSMQPKGQLNVPQVQGMQGNGMQQQLENSKTPQLQQGENEMPTEQMEQKYGGYKYRTGGYRYAGGGFNNPIPEDNQLNDNSIKFGEFNNNLKSLDNSMGIYNTGIPQQSLQGIQNTPNSQMQTVNYERADLVNPLESKTNNYTQGYNPQVGDINSIKQNTPYTGKYPTTTQQGSGTESYKTLGNTAGMQGLVGAIPSLVGNAYMYNNAKEQPVNYQRVDTNLVDRSREREIAERTANESKATNYRNLRNVGETQGTVLGGIGAINAGVNRTLGDVLGQSYSNEYNTNAALKNQTSAQNAQIQMQETEARARERDAVNDQKNSAIKGSLQAMTNYGTGILQNQSDLMKTSAMMPTDYKLVSDGRGGVTSIYTGKDSPYKYEKGEWVKKIKSMGGYKYKK